MKITIRQLKHLIREAAYEGPGTASLKTGATSFTRFTGDMRQSAVTKLRLVGVKRRTGITRTLPIADDRAVLEVYLADNKFRWHDPRRHESIISKQEFRDLLRSLGFSERSLKDVDFDYHGGGKRAIEIDVGSVFIAEWIELFDDEKTVWL